MRAHEFPLHLFQTIHQAVGQPVIEEWPGKPRWRYFRIIQGTRAIAHLGYEEYDWTGNKFGKVVLWGHMMREPMTDDNEWETKRPYLEIVGGPHETGHWAYGSGNLLREGVKLHLNGGIGDIQSPFVSILGQVLTLAYQLGTETQLPDLTYWQAFKNPGQKFEKP